MSIRDALFASMKIMKNALHAALQLLKSCNAISAQVSGLAAGMDMEREMKRRLKSGLAARGGGKES